MIDRHNLLDSSELTKMKRKGALQIQSVLQIDS